MRITPLLLAATTSLFLCSCQKEISADYLNSNPQQPEADGLKGTWTFAYSHIITNSTVEITDEFSDVRSVTLSDYITTNNKGTLTINDTAMVSSGVSYDVSSVLKSYTYENGNLEDSLDFPLQASIPPSNSSSLYQVVGTDSISVPAINVGQVAGATGVQASLTGYKFSIRGDSLMLTGHIVQNFQDNSMGVPIATFNTATVTTALGRQ